MRMMAFAGRNGKEVARDPLSVVFGIGFPVVLILLINLMKSSFSSAPAELFPIVSFAPGMAVFGLSFLTLFVGLLLAGDRESSFLLRIFASPLQSRDYILGYSLPMIPVALVQSLACFVTAFFFGLRFDGGTLLAVVVLLPVGLLFVGLGLLLGSVLSYRQVGGISSIVVNLAAWLSGTWFDLELMGGAFRTVCYLLPFAHAVDAVKAALSGNYAQILPHLGWVLGYTVVVYAAAVAVFRKKMKG